MNKVTFDTDIEQYFCCKTHYSLLIQTHFIPRKKKTHLTSIKYHILIETNKLIPSDSDLSSGKQTVKKTQLKSKANTKLVMYQILKRISYAF